MNAENQNLITTELITPQKAQQYLERNCSANKPIQEKKINTLVEKIKCGNWDAEGEMICFLEGGVLSNGQHRLHAIIRANIAVNVKVFNKP